VNAPQPQTVSRITEPVNDSLRVVLKGNVPRQAQAKYDQGPVPASMPASRLMLVLKHSPTQAQAVREFIDSLQDKSSPNYHKWLTPEEFGAKYGPSDQDLKTLTAWLESHGFTVNRVAKARNLIEFSGTAGSVQEAFHTAIHSYVINGEQHFSIATDPEIPAALAPVVAGVTKLNNFNPKRNVMAGKSARWNAEKGPGNDITWIDPYGNTDLYVVPADVAAIYNTPNAQLNPAYTGTTYDGTGVTVGIVGDSNFTMQDVANYRTFFLNDTSAAHLPNVIIDGNDPGIISGDSLEALLDNEALGGVAPGATINFYTAANTDVQAGLELAISRALDDNAVSILNLSFGYCEQLMGATLNQEFYQAWEQAAAQGISVTVSSGDTGSANCDAQDQAVSYDGLAVSGFASTPYNVSVGGTDFAVLTSNYPTSFNQYMNPNGGVAPYYGSATGYIPETPWNNTTYPNTTINLNQTFSGESLGGGGGGMSSCTTQDQYGDCLSGYPKPAFQANLTPVDGVRDVPDVSLFASNGFNAAIWAICADSAVYDTPGTDCQLVDGKPTAATTISGVGGTSASAPAFAGMLALISQSVGGRLGNPNPALYSLAMNTPAVINDVVVGNNSQPCGSIFVPGCVEVASTDFYLSGYNAGTGYDLASGLGSVNAAKLVNAWPTATFTPTSEPVFLIGESQATESPNGLTATHGTPIDFFLVITPDGGQLSGNVTLVTDSDVAVLPNSGGVGTVYPVNSPTVTGGVVTGTTNTLPGGSYNLYAYYGGDTNFAASKSNPIPVTINPESSSTTLAVSFYDASSLQSIGSTTAPYGSIFFFDGTPQSQNTQNPFDGVPTGTITFLNGTTPVGPAVNLNSSGSADFDNYYGFYNQTAPPAGSYQLVASYSGDASFLPSKSAPASITITKGPISSALSSSTAGLNYGGSVTLTVAIQTDSFGNYPTGSISFMSGATVLGTAPIVGSNDPNTGLDLGTATATIAGTQFTANGNNYVYAAYAGDANYSSANSNNVLLDVTGVPVPKIGVSGPTTIALADPGASSAATITVTPFGGFTGAVNLTCTITGPSNAVSIPTCTPATATITGTTAVTATVNVDSTSTTTADTYSLLVTGADAATGKITASTTIPVTVSAPPPPSFALSSVAAVIAAPGSSTTSAITVTPSNGFTGAVNLTCSSVTAGLTCTPATATVGASGGTASLNIQSTSATPVGADTLTVTGADAATGAITASTTVQVTVSAPIIAGLTLSSTPVTITSPGATGTSTITLTPAGGLSGTVTLTCTVTASPLGAVSAPACPSTTATIAGSTAVTATLSLQTTVTTTPGAYTIAVTATDGSTVATTNVALTVNASTTPAGFALSGTQVSIASLGTNGSSTITVTPAGGFTGQVNLKCAMTTAPSGVNDNPTCTFGSTNSVFISGTASATATMTVNTSTTAAALHLPHRGSWVGSTGGVLVAGLIFFFLPTRRRNRFAMLALLIMAVAAGAIGCGGSSKPTVDGTGAFTFTVTGTDAATGTIVSTTTVTVNVQ
jgi:hypothetical protein